MAFLGMFNRVTFISLFARGFIDQHKKESDSDPLVMGGNIDQTSGKMELFNLYTSLTPYIKDTWKHYRVAECFKIYRSCFSLKSRF